jgi:hypothetical protein
MFTGIEGAKDELRNDLLMKSPKLILVPKFQNYFLWVGKDIRDLIEDVVAKNYKLSECKYGYDVYEKTF